MHMNCRVPIHHVQATDHQVCEHLYCTTLTDKVMGKVRLFCKVSANKPSNLLTAFSGESLCGVGNSIAQAVVECTHSFCIVCGMLPHEASQSSLAQACTPFPKEGIYSPTVTLLVASSCAPRAEDVPRGLGFLSSTLAASMPALQLRIDCIALTEVQ